MPPAPSDQDAHSSQDSIASALRTTLASAGVPDHSGAAARDVAATSPGAARAAGDGVLIAVAVGNGGSTGSNFNGFGNSIVGGPPAVSSALPYRGGVAVGPVIADLARASFGSRAFEGSPSNLIPYAGISRMGDPSDAGKLLGEGSVEPVKVAIEVAALRRADLLTDFIPFDRGALEHAIDGFLTRFEDLGMGLSRLGGPTDLVTEVLAVTVALAGSTLAVQLLERSTEDEGALAGADVGANFEGYPGMPDPWSL
jgi:hypothetical protein